MKSDLEYLTTAALLRRIEAAQNTQKRCPPSSAAWQAESEILAPLFREMARRSQPHWDRLEAPSEIRDDDAPVCEDCGEFADVIEPDGVTHLCEACASLREVRSALQPKRTNYRKTPSQYRLKGHKISYSTSGAQGTYWNAACECGWVSRGWYYRKNQAVNEAIDHMERSQPPVQR